MRKKSSRAVKDIKFLEVWGYVLKICLVCLFLGIHYAGIRGSFVCLDHVALQPILLFQRTLFLSQANCFFSFLICNYHLRERQVAVCVLGRFLGLWDVQICLPTKGRRIVSHKAWASAVTRKQYFISCCF